ncbi:ATP-binding cassette domain-containing protein [Corynebacterium auriscanis]|uniref:ATP-binding cassette domain-containing protein n=1 Tax=Corynebacterium auriscanis TaxID=99807 RepID=UPI0022461A1E|nr:ATP-binding cassette domain-containing protein [Corynebacterium auriscanis]
MNSRISAVNLSKSVGSKNSPRWLWRQLNFDVSAGELVGISGPSGSGKSTLLNCLGLLEEPDSGEVLINGNALASASGRRRMSARRQHVGYLFQDYALIDNETVRRNVALASQKKENN